MDSQNENRNGLPHGWATGTLQNLIGPDGLFIDGDWVETKDQDPNGDVRLIQLADVGDGEYRNKSKRFLTSAKAQELGCTYLKPSDVLVGRMPDPLGRSCIFPGDIKPSVTVVDVCIVRTGEHSVDHRWLMHTINSPQFRVSVAELQSGSTRKRISRGNLSTLNLPVPPLPEQRRIVAKIEELFTKLDAGVKALNEIKAQLKRYRQSVLKAAFKGKLTKEWREVHKGELEPASTLLERIKEERKRKLGNKYRELPPIDTSELPELSEGWAWARVADIGEVETGTTPPKTRAEYYGKDYPFFKPTDLNSGYYTKVSEDGLSLKGMEQARLLPAKSILVTCIGATIGKTGFIRKEGGSNQQINAIIAENHILPEFIYFICISSQFQKEIVDHASATTLPILNKKKFEVLTSPIAPFREQQEIVSEIERCFSVADAIEKTVEQGLARSERLRQSILKRAFEGKLVPQDATDEPAEKLLERIKLAREMNADKEKKHPRR
jgi:type I restriction enzyme S subunit